MPVYPDRSKLEAAEAKLSDCAPLVFAGEIRSLQEQLAKVCMCVCVRVCVCTVGVRGGDMLTARAARQGSPLEIPVCMCMCMCMCMCVRACVRVCVRARMRMCACVLVFLWGKGSSQKGPSSLRLCGVTSLSYQEK